MFSRAILFSVGAAVGSVGVVSAVVSEPVTAVSVVNEAVTDTEACSEVGVVSTSAAGTSAARKRRTGAVDTSLATGTGSVTDGAPDKAGSSGTIVRVDVVGSGARTVRGFTVVCASGLEELVVCVAASVKARLAPPVESTVAAALAPGVACDATGLSIEGDSVVVVGDPVRDVTELTVVGSVGCGLLADELAVAFTRSALPVATAL